MKAKKLGKDALAVQKKLLEAFKQEHNDIQEKHFEEVDSLRCHISSLEAELQARVEPALRIEREAREQRELAQRRRAYLRGLYDGFGCPPAQMRRAFEAYGLVEEEQD